MTDLDFAPRPAPRRSPPGARPGSHGGEADAAQRRAAAARRRDPGDRADRRRHGRRPDRLSLEHDAIDVFAPGVLALAIMSTAFTSLAIATGFERRYGVIKRLGSSPLPRSGLLAGKVLALLLVEVLQVVVISAVAFALGWDPDPHVVGALLAIVAGTAAFASLGLFVAGVLRAEATLAAANLIYLLLLAGGAVVLPVSAYGAFGHVVRWLPSGALGSAMREALIDGGVAWRDLGVLVLWAAVGTTLTARTFKWE